jgi:hypothetical protein
MTPLIPYAIHYFLYGVAQHFYTVSGKLDDLDALRLATRHAAQNPPGASTLAGPRSLAQRATDKVAVSKVRWNLAV